MIHFKSNCLLLFLTLNFANIKAVVKCPLEWITMGGTEEIPSTGLPLFPPSPGSDPYKSIFIIKGYPKPGSISEKVGYMEASLLLGQGRLTLIPGEALLDISVSPPFFKILTNPHGCNVEWLGILDPTRYPVYQQKDSKDVQVGRGTLLIKSTSNDLSISILKYVSGGISGGRITLAKSNETSQYSANFQYLHSNSPGLSLKLQKFRITNTAPGKTRKEVLGLDQIFNESPATVRHSVKHEAKIKEEKVLTTTSTFSKAFKVEGKISIELKVNVSIPGDYELPGDPVGWNGTNWNVVLYPFSVELSHSFDTEDKTEDKTRITQRTETNMGLNREVEIPPFTSVQICSTITIQPFNTSYTGDGVYSAPGLNAEEIEEILNTGYKGRSPVFIKHRNSIISKESGTFSGYLAVASAFFVMLTDDPFGCDVVLAN